MIKCQRVHCTDEAQWLPLLVVDARNSAGSLRRVVVPLHMCEAHKAEATVSGLVFYLGREPATESTLSRLSIEWVSTADFDRDFLARSRPIRGGDAGR